MKKIPGLFIIPITILVMALPGLSASLAQTTVQQTSTIQEADSLLLKFQDHLDPVQVQSFIADQHLHSQGYLPQIGVWQVAPQTKTPASALVDLQNAPGVLWVEPNQWVHATQVIPNDNFFQAQQENLRVIGLPEAWSYTTGLDLPLAIIDSGIDLDHPDLKNKLWQNPGEIPGNLLDDDQNGFVDDLNGWDFVNDDAVPQDDNSHGSHVAGIAAAETNNVIGIAGVSWGARIMAIKALNQNGDGSWFDVASAILYAADMGGRIINMSFGAADSSLTIEAAVQYATNRDCLLIASAGNGGGAVLYPAALPEVMAIAATDNLDLPWSYSNRGPEIELAAPGVHIISTNATGSYIFLDGTSMSAPHVSGVAALLWSLKPGYTAQQIRGVLISSAKDVWSSGWDWLTGWGRLDAYQALRSVTAPTIYLPVMAFKYSSLQWTYLPLLFSDGSSPQ
jgi:subtilisin family serine protease